jgi:hypothetical protein
MGEENEILRTLLPDTVRSRIRDALTKIMDPPI